MTRAIYPGSFDPFHHGHRDIARRAAALFDELIITVFDAPAQAAAVFRPKSAFSWPGKPFRMSKIFRLCHIAD